ncbi:MAG: hypothetical protein SNJ78_04710 [Spirochaetales bacterium]
MGKGHISPIVFREGVLYPDCTLFHEELTSIVTEPIRSPHSIYHKNLFQRKLLELNLINSFSTLVLGGLSEFFTLSELIKRIELLRRNYPSSEDIQTTARGMILLAESNYEVTFSPDKKTAEKVIFPSSPSQSNGIEDARFVLFQEEDGAKRYYATYTAYDGRVILPQLLKTEDFVTFRFYNLNGLAVRNKGMALFPRKNRRTICNTRKAG